MAHIYIYVYVHTHMYYIFWKLCMYPEEVPEDFLLGEGEGGRIIRFVILLK